MFKNILFVCVGNICRSPTAEYLAKNIFQQFDKSVTVKSAGLAAVVGAPIVENAKIILDQHKIDSSAHRAQQLSADLIRESDIIFTMEEWQINEVSFSFSAAHGKIFSLGKWRNEEISDPYRKSFEIFEKTFSLIELNWALWLQKLWKIQNPYGAA